MTNKLRLFYASCFALITTAFSFSIRAGVMEDLQKQLDLTSTELGFINQMWFWGFPISMIIGGMIYHRVGGSKIMQFAFFAHTFGILLTIFGGSSYILLLISSLLIGLGNGCTEAACNPMIADAYQGNTMSKMMNRFHMWFPGGIFLAGLLSAGMGWLNWSWQVQIAIILIPTVIYAYLFWGVPWPAAKIKEQTSVSANFNAMLTPLFIFILVCMAFTATTEFGPNQWVPITLKGSLGVGEGMEGEGGNMEMVVLALTFGVMAIARYFGGSAVARLNTTGVLLASAILACIGLYMLSMVSGAMVYLAAIVYGLGIAYFWPNMLGFTAEYIPKSGALGLSIVGAVGMFMSGLIQPIFGGLIDSNRAALEGQYTGNDLDIAVGQATLSTMTLLPLVLIVLFTILYFWMKNHSKKASEEAAELATDY